MSSNTTYRAAPAGPAAPPLVVSTGAGHTATSVCGILGPNGCKLIRDTLTDLARGPKSALLSELAEGQAEAAIDLRGWKADAHDPTRFTREIDGTEVEVLTGGAALEVRFRFAVTGARVLTPAELQQHAAGIQRKAHRSVNKVLAVVALKAVVQHRVREKVKVAQPARVRVVNNAVRLTCVAPIRS